MARFSNDQVAEPVQPFWAALQADEFIADAAVQAGTYRKQGTRWVAACGGVRPGHPLLDLLDELPARNVVALGVEQVGRAYRAAVADEDARCC